MNNKTYKLYMEVQGVSELVDTNIKGDRNIGQIMSRISGITSAVGSDCYETAKTIISLTKAERKAPQDPAVLKRIAAVKKAMGEG